MLEIKGISPYYEDEHFRLYLGDSREVLKFLPHNSIDMVFADPPYGLSNDGFTCRSGQRGSVNKGSWDRSSGLEEDFHFHQSWIKAVRRVLKDAGTIWVSGSYHSIYICGFALQLAGFKILNDVAWFKPNGPPNLSCRYFTASHETLIWAIKSPNAKHTFHYELMKNGDWDKTDILKRPHKQMRSVWSIAKPPSSEKKWGKHPTQKPELLLKRIILASTNKGDLILDPFAGSSTTGLVASMFGREYIGIDTNEQYLDLSIRRYEGFKRNLAEDCEKKGLSLANCF